MQYTLTRQAIHIHQNSLRLARTLRTILFRSPQLLLTFSCSFSIPLTFFFHSLFFSPATSETKALEHPNLAANLLRVHLTGCSARSSFIASIFESDICAKGPFGLSKEGRDTGGSVGSVHDVGSVPVVDGKRRSGDEGEVVSDSGAGAEGGGLWMNVRSFLELGSERGLYVA